MKTKRSLWPFGIVAVFVLFTLGLTVLITLACSSGREDLVADDYYEQEIRYQGQIDRLSRAQQLPAKATVTYDSSARSIRISLPHEHAVDGAHGELYLYRPSTAGLDQQVQLNIDATGVQRLDATGLKPGLWKVKVVWTVAGQDFAIEQAVVVGT